MAFNISTYCQQARDMMAEPGGPEMIHQVCERLAQKVNRTIEEELRLAALEKILFGLDPMTGAKPHGPTL